MINKIYVAPMVGRTDKYFRALVRSITSDFYLYTEMITCDAFLRTDKVNCELHDYEKGTIIQLAGSDPEKFLKCSKIIESSDYSEININIGCPSNRVIKGSFGACLIKNPSIVAECIDAIKSKFTRTISIKTRLGLGYEENLDPIVDFISKTSESGCKKFIIHARNAILSGLSPKKNRAIPNLRYDDALMLKKNFPSLEFIINGGINSLDMVKSNINRFDGMMIGRKIYSDPMFLLDLDQLMNKTTNIISRRQVIEKYIMICNDYDINNNSKYLLLRHLYGLYYGTSSSKIWKKFLNNLIITKNDIENLLTFPENIYVEEIKNYG